MQENENNHQANYLTLLESRKYDPTRDPGPEQILFRIDGKNIGTIQNIVTISGLPKAGKSRFLGAIAASGISSSEIFNMSLRVPEDRPGIGYFDTEQGDYDFIKTVKYISKLSGGITDNFHAYSTREDFPGVQLKLIRTFLHTHPDCSVLILDGILDLLDSFNDERESVRLMRLLKKWSKELNLLIILVLHRKKDGTSTLGHIGSAIDRASQSILTVEKNKERGTYMLKPEYLRSTDDFTPIEIFYNKGSDSWERTFSDQGDSDKVKKMRKLTPQELLIEDHQLNVRRIFNVERPQTYESLRKNISEFYIMGKNWSESCIKYLLDQNLIFKTVAGYTNVKEQKMFVATAGENK